MCSISTAIAGCNRNSPARDALRDDDASVLFIGGKDARGDYSERANAVSLRVRHSMTVQ